MVLPNPSASDCFAIGWPWEVDADHGATPRLRHWLVAAAILLVMGITVPVFAALA